MYRIILSENNYLRECPQYWKNFIKHEYKESASIKSNINQLRYCLMGYNCAMFNEYAGVDFGIEFESKEDATAFILKWS